MSQKPLVSVIVVNWNGGDVFADCLESLRKVTYSNWELIVVDNGSSDNSADKLNKFNNSAKLIMNKENVGFAIANNQGLEIAQGEYILLLNNDTKVKQNFLTQLVNRIEKEREIGVIQPKVRLMDEHGRLDTVGSFLTSTGFLDHWGYLKKDSSEFNNESFIFSAKGACMLVKKKVIDEVGLFDDSFGSYFEETDFCWRVWLAGYKILYYPRSEIFHRVGYSSKRQNQIFVNYNAFKNRLSSIIKNLEILNLVKIGGLHLVIISLLAVYYLITFKFEKSLMILKAIKWNLLHIREILEKRKNVTKIRRKKDDKIFPIIMRSVNWKNMILHFLRAEKMLEGKHEV